MNESSRRMMAAEPFALPNSGDWPDLAVSVENIRREPLDALLSRVDSVRVLRATAMLWLAIGTLLWWQSASPLRRGEAPADRLELNTSSAGELSPTVALARIEPEAPQLPAPTPVPVVPWPVELAAEDSAEWEDASEDDSPETVTAARNPHEAPAPARLAAARPTTLFLVAVGGAALARPPPAPAVYIATLPSDATSGRVYTQGPASPSAAIAPAESRPASSCVGATARGPVTASKQTTSPPVTRSQASGGQNSSSGMIAGGGMPRGTASGALRPDPVLVQPIAIVPDTVPDRMLSEAWGPIERTDGGPGRSRLLQVGNLTSGDPRADFSPGLLDGTIENDFRKMEYTAPHPAPRTGATTPITLARRPNAAIGAPAADVSPAMFPWRAIPLNPPDTSLV